MIGLFLIFFALDPNLSEDIVSSEFEDSFEQQMMSDVFEFPPNDS